MYGPEDHFDPEDHILGALIKKFLRKKKALVEVWGGNLLENGM